MFSMTEAMCTCHTIICTEYTYASRHRVSLLRKLLQIQGSGFKGSRERQDCPSSPHSLTVTVLRYILCGKLQPGTCLATTLLLLSTAESSFTFSTSNFESGNFRSVCLTTTKSSALPTYFSASTRLATASPVDSDPFSTLQVNMAADIQIAQLLDATLDPQQHRKGTPLRLPSVPFAVRRPSIAVQNADLCSSTAESLLKLEEKKPQYSLQLLKIVAEQSLAIKTRLAAALAFKNYVRLNYVVRTSCVSSPCHA